MVTTLHKYKLAQNYFKCTVAIDAAQKVHGLIWNFTPNKAQYSIPSICIYTCVLDVSEEALETSGQI